MGQLSMFEKQRHHSHKDFTCSIGKHDVVYITFRNESWKRFTKSDNITVLVKGGVLCFGDPTKDLKAPAFKMKKNAKGYESTRERTRYIQIEGKMHPGILEVVRAKAGSYDFPKEQKKEDTKQKEFEEFKKRWEEFQNSAATLTIDGSVFNTSELTPRATLDYYLAQAQSPEERVEIFRTFGPMLAPHQIPRPAPDKWDIP